MDVTISQLYLLAGATLLGLWATSVRKSRSNPNGLPLPPGPKGYPVVGNLFDMPKEKMWLIHDQWFQSYGDMVYYEILGQPILILGSLKRTNDLFEKRSSNYSSRVQKLPMLLDLMGAGWSFAFMPYGATWRRHRKAFHEHFHPNVVPKYQPIQAEAAKMFLRRLLASPDDFMDHIRHYFAGSIMEICYGITVLEDNDPYISIAKEAMEGIAEAGPGAFLVDLLPVLKYVPRWLPGAEFKRKAARWRACLCEMLERPYPRVKWELESGNARPSILQSMISNLPDESDPKRGEAEKMAKAVTAAAYGGGSDTIIAVVQAFFLAMAMYPDVQRKAQAEIDAVVGQDRLPNFSDQAKLPYVNGIVQETLRWHPIFPKGVPHMSTEDDEYDGYFIPKGTIVMGNVWTILHDPNAFPDPLKYEPERYLNIKDADGCLDDTIRSPGAAAFGFGRRVCPGRHLADTSLYAAVSNVLAVYNIKPPTDDEGNEVKLREEVTNGILSYMVPFKCVIEPRSSVALALIRGV